MARPEMPSPTTRVTPFGTLTICCSLLAWAVSGSAHLEGRQADQHQHHGDDPETHDDPRLRPPLELVVVVDRRHAEDAPPGQLVGAHLEDHRDGLHDEDPPHDEEHDLLDRKSVV